MNSKSIFQVVSFVVYIFAQGVVFRNVVLFDTAFCFVYVAFLLCFPVNANNLVLMMLAFIMGITIDIFYDSLGMHAAASVFIMFIRNYWLEIITPRGGYETGAMPKVDMNGLKWFAGYILPMLFLHHTALFFIEAASASHFWFTMMKVIMSTLFSALFIIIFQYLFYRNKRY